MPENVDAGNPNVFKLYRGMYEMNMVDGVTSSDDARVMLTILNEVKFLDDVEFQTYTAGERFATMADQCRPVKDAKVPVALTVGERETIELMTVRSDGMMSLGTDVAGGVLNLSSATYSIASKFYGKAGQ